MILLLTIVWLVSNGQTGPVFQYTTPSKETLKSLTLEESSKGYAYRNYLIGVVAESLIDTLKISEKSTDLIFNNLFFEEVYFEEGEYKNSGYDSTAKKMVPSIGHEKTMFVWVVRIGSYIIPLIKGDCGNILVAKVIRKKPLSVEGSEQVDPSPSFVEQDLSDREQSFSPPKDLGTAFREFKEPTENPVVEEFPDLQQKRRRPGLVIAGVALGTAGLATVFYFIFKKPNIPNIPPPDNGKPGGVPGHRDGKSSLIIRF